MPLPLCDASLDQLGHHFLGSGSSLESLFSLYLSLWSSLLSCLSHLQPLSSHWGEIQQPIKTEPKSLIIEEIFSFLIGQPFYYRKEKKRTKYSNICIYSQKFPTVIFDHLYVLSFSIAFLFPQGKKAREGMITIPGSGTVNLSINQ